MTRAGRVASLEDTLKQAESLTVMPPMDVAEGPAITQLADPEGNVFGLVKQ